MFAVIGKFDFVFKFKDRICVTGEDPNLARSQARGGVGVAKPSCPIQARFKLKYFIGVGRG